MRYVEHGLELKRNLEGMPDEIRTVMEGYNREDCFSTAGLRDWLEEERRKLVDRGTDVPRFVDREEEASESLYRLGSWVRDNGIEAAGPWKGVRDFLLRKPPELLNSETLKISGSFCTA